MKYISSKGSDIVLQLSDQELRALLDVVNEFSRGPFALSDDEWNQVMLQPREIEAELLVGLAAAVDQFNAKH